MQRNQSFVILLKTKGGVSKLDVSCDDSRESLFEKLKIVYPECANKSEQSMEKIRKQLSVLSQSTGVKEELKSLIRKCMRNVFQDGESGEIECQITEVLMPSRVKSCQTEIIATPIQRSRSIETQTQSYILTDKHDKLNRNRNISNLKTQNIGLSKNNAKKIEINKNQNILQSVTIPRKKKSCNPDIVKACESIMKKTNQNEMKVMARQFLKEKGFLKDEKEVIRQQKKKIVTEPSQPVQPNPQTRPVRSTLLQRPIYSSTIQDTPIQLIKEGQLKSQYILNRFKYLNCSMQDLKNEYTRNESVQNKEDPPLNQKKYRYLDD